MRSKITKVTAALLVTFVPFVTTCGSGPFDDDEKYQIGRKPEFFSAAYLWHGGAANTLVAFEKESRTLQQFQVEPFEHQKTIDLPLKYEKQGVAAGAGGGYFITMAENEYAIVKSDGSYALNPVPLTGTIKSIAFNPDQHLAVISDDFQSIVVLVLTSGGDILGSLKKGPQVLPDKLAMSGTMMTDGRLVLALGETTIAVVDLKKSVAEQDWRFARDPFEVTDAKAMNWMSSLPEGGDIVLVADDNRLLSINVASGNIVDQKDLTGSAARGYYRDYTPHVVHQSGTTVLDSLQEISYVGADGKIATSKKIVSNSYQITSTWFDPATDLFTIVYDPDKDHTFDFDEEQNTEREIYRIRLSDSLVLDKSETPSRAKLIVTPANMLLLYESILGKAERRSYGPTPATLSLKGYNLELLKDRYSEDD